LIRPLPKVPVRLIRPGQEVNYQGWPYKVKYTYISRHGLFVVLDGVENPVKEELLDVKPTIVDFEQARRKK
jgi:hypothetical protein